MGNFWYFLLGARIVVLGGFLANAFGRIAKLENRVDELESEEKRKALSSR
jgi:hypothetical protein